MFNETVEGIVERLLEHLSSKDVKERFTSWSLDEVPAMTGSLTEVGEKVYSLLSSRFQEILCQWEEETEVFEVAHLFLAQNFQNCFDDVEFQLRMLQIDAIYVESGKQKFRFRIVQFQKREWIVKVFFYGLPSLVSLLSFDLRSPFNQAYNLTNRASWTVQALYKDLLSNVSEGILARIRNPSQLKSFVDDKLKDAKLYLDRIEARLSEMIKADRDLYEQLVKEETKPSRYQPLLNEVGQHRHQLALLGLTEVCSVKIDGEKLDWKEERSSCLGWGTFATVYQGTMRSDGGITTVALKVWNDALDDKNAIEIVEEIKNLRYEANFQR